MRIETLMYKDEILLAYLNKIPYGNGSSGYNAYGIKAAAKGIFNISELKDLNIAQAAYLAGVPQLPSNFSAFSSKTTMAELNRERRLPRASSRRSRQEAGGQLTANEERRGRLGERGMGGGGALREWVGIPARAWRYGRHHAVAVLRGDVGGGRRARSVLPFRFHGAAAVSLDGACSPSRPFTRLVADPLDALAHGSRLRRLILTRNVRRGRRQSPGFDVLFLALDPAMESQPHPDQRLPRHGREFATAMTAIREV